VDVVHVKAQAPIVEADWPGKSKRSAGRWRRCALTAALVLCYLYAGAVPSRRVAAHCRVAQRLKEQGKGCQVCLPC
jgi:hypothetical protein